MVVNTIRVQLVFPGLVSGFSPSILKSILKGEIYTPTQLMLDTIDTRYSDITID